MRFVVSERLDQKLERIKALTSHKKFNPSYAELIEMMADLVLDRIDPEKKKKRPAPAAGAATHTPAPPPAEVVSGKGGYQSKSSKDDVWPAQAQCQTGNKRVESVQGIVQRANEHGISMQGSARCTKEHARSSQASLPTRYVSVETKRALFSRAGSRCEYVHSGTKRRCEETRFLQIEHIVPYAFGGATEASNLEVLCAAHNRLRAIQAGLGRF